MYLDRDTRHPITPQLAVRVAIIGGVALVMFAVVFFRLWYLQVLSGDKYKAEANNNRVREITIEAPRGRILDRNGKVLVDNRYGLAVTVSPDKLPKSPHAQAAAAGAEGRSARDAPAPPPAARDRAARAQGPGGLGPGVPR